MTNPSPIERRTKAAHGFSENRYALMEVERFRFCLHFRNGDHASMGHVVMVWAEGHQVGQFVGTAVLSSHDMMDRSDDIKSADDAPISITNPSRVLSCPLERSRFPGHHPAVVLDATFLGAKTLGSSLQHARGDQHFFTAYIAGVVLSVVKRMLLPGASLPELITAIRGAILSIRGCEALSGRCTRSASRCECSTPFDERLFRCVQKQTSSPV